MRPRPSVLLGAALAALPSLGCAVATSRAASQSLAQGALPAVDLATLDGRPARLPGALDGRPALISLWATWCEACAEEFEPLARLDARAKARGALVLAIAEGEPRAQVAEFVARRGLAWTQLCDEEFRFADRLGQRRVPATLVVDRAGRVVYTGGALDAAALAAFEREIDRR